MRRLTSSVVAVAAVLILPQVGAAQGGMDASRSVAGGGISAPGWMGAVDPTEGGMSAKDAKLSLSGGTFSVTTGPAITYWNPANTAAGDYTVKATFTEPKFMNLNNHPHPYGIMIGGNDLGTANASFLYCEAYGTGRFIVRGFGPSVFNVTSRAEANPAIHKAAGPGQPVTQEIAMSVKGDKVTCSINGTVVGTYDKSAVVGEGKLKSLDGVYGIRFAHNTEGTVSGLTMTKP
ncbi:MAG: hypothetical protein ACHQWU_02725 [Gemmatimonadales bacterium]